MAVFLLVHGAGRLALRNSIKARFAEHFEIDDKSIVFRSSESAQAVVEGAALPDSEKSDVVVYQLSPDYWGYKSQALWNWLPNAFKSDRGG